MTYNREKSTGPGYRDVKEWHESAPLASNLTPSSLGDHVADSLGYVPFDGSNALYVGQRCHGIPRIQLSRPSKRPCFSKYAPVGCLSSF